MNIQLCVYIFRDVYIRLYSLDMVCEYVVYVCLLDALRFNVVGWPCMRL